MFFILLVFFAFIFGGYYIGKSIGGFIDDNIDTYNKESNITINNYHSETHNHLHVSEDQLKQLSKGSKS